MKKSYQFRIYPNKNQEVKLIRTLDTCRHLYNDSLAERKRQAELNKLKKEFDLFPWGKTEWINKYDKSILPPDAVQKGYRTVVVQNIKFATDNVEYKLEYYYSKSERKTYEAELPNDIRGEFGTELKAFIVYLYFGCRVTENKIKTILEESGIIISEGQISNILTKEKKEEMTKEKEDIFLAGMENSTYIHMDDTGMKHKGVNHHLHVICNILFSVFFIELKKDSKTIQKILGLINDETLEKILLSDDAYGTIMIN
jgi:transposase